MPDIALNGIDMHYEVDGTGPPLILLAGMLSDSASWGPLVAPLAQHHTVIRPDNRTTGRTTPWDAPVSVNQMAQDAAALMAALGHDTYHVVGHSMGGLMAMELSSLAPLASLTILCSAPVRVPRTMAMFDTLSAIRDEPNGEELWLRALYPWAFRPEFFIDPGNVQTALHAALAYPYAQTAPAMRHQIEALRSYRPSLRPADITARTQVIFAEHDLMIPEGPGRAAFAAIRDVTMHTVPDAGHSIHWDAPEAVLNLILPFTGATA
ncbi:MAG: alpha/beta hydrolase [Pseudomonadota bacterium]